MTLIDKLVDMKLSDLNHIYREIYTHTYTHSQGAIGKFLSKLCKNENNTNISLYQIYLPKLQENILKYYRFNLFKEIAIDFNHGIGTIQNLLQAFPTASLFKLLNAAVILPFSSFLVLQRVWEVPCSTTPTPNNQGGYNLGG